MVCVVLSKIHCYFDILLYWDNKDEILSDLTCPGWNFISEMCCYIYVVNECNF